MREVAMALFLFIVIQYNVSVLNFLRMKTFPIDNRIANSLAETLKHGKKTTHFKTANCQKALNSENFCKI
jgi:hypothetical protein